MRSPFKTFILTLSLVFLGAGALPAADTIERSFRVQPGGELLIESDAGDVTVTGGRGDEARIRIESNRELDGWMEFTFRQEGSRVALRGERLRREGILGIFGRGTQGRIRITAETPENFDIKVKTSGGNVTASGIEGPVEMRTSGGDVTAVEVSGTVNVKTSGGDIELREINGPVTATTSGGDVTARRVLGTCILSTSGGDIEVCSIRGDCRLKTSGGGIEADSVDGVLDARTSGGNIKACLGSGPFSPCELHTSGGNIVLSLPASASADLSARTSGGSVESELPVKVYKSARGEMEGTLARGGPSLVLRTSGGNIRLRKTNQQ